MNFKIGETIKINGVDLLVLNIIDGNPFVIALDTGIKTKFDDDSTNYKESVLQSKVGTWFMSKFSNVKVISREVDLTAMDGDKSYGTIVTNCAPLTFDEYRKYAHILKGHIKNWFWLVTPWGALDGDSWASDGVCYVSGNGTAGYGDCNSSSGLAPAFVIDKNCFEKSIMPDPDILKNFDIDTLLKEIANRCKEE